MLLKVFCTKMHKIILIAFKLMLTFNLVICNFQPSLVNNFGSKDEKLKAEKQAKLPPCKSCTIFVDSFKKVNFFTLIIFNHFILNFFLKGLDKTSRGKHDGGDADWEEQKLGSYKTSEVRLIEIQEMLCSDIPRGEQQCHSIAEEHESDIEYWWKRQEEHPDLFKWFCIDTLKVCCPQNHYGKDCTECPKCSGNGVCKGNGTRKGNGKCNCDRGYGKNFILN